MQTRINQRKHVTQMTSAEIDAVRQYASSVKVWRNLDNPHILERKLQWRISNSEILKTLWFGDVIEVHQNNYPDTRMVLRKTQGNRSICVCVSVSGNVITAWVNGPKDNHSTLDVSQYRLSIDLTKLFA